MHSAPKIATIQDISGIGRCSMTVALPVLSAMGSQCCPLPTAWLSAHTGFPDAQEAVFLDLTEQMAGTMRHWRALGMRFDAVYSGFLGSQAQITPIEEFHANCRSEGTLIVVDPVMGDHGKPYRTCTPELCSKMMQLAAGADLITPNLTEAALLLGEEYATAPRDERGLRAWLGRLSQGGKRSVALTGVSLAPGQIGAGCMEAGTGQIHFAMARQEPGQFPGTGDLFASVLVGALLRGKRLAEAAEQAVAFVQKCAARTISLGTPILEGVQFEGLLGELTQE